MVKKKLDYGEGSWFAVPLQNKGYGIGVIARIAPKRKVAFGYFFGPKRDSPKVSIDEIRNLKPQGAVLIGQFGDLGLYEGTWPLIYQQEDWNPTDWPMPSFGRIDEDAKKAWKTTYLDNDPNTVIKDEPCLLEEAKKLPRDTLMGSGSVEIRLTKILSEE